LHTRHEQRHKFAVGQSVTLVKRLGEIRPKDIEQDFINGAFEITRLLPAEAWIFHYRIKDAATGRERVVAEDQIAVITQ
jgi:hypothetical protein